MLKIRTISNREKVRIFPFGAGNRAESCMKLLSHELDDDTPSVKGCFWLGYAVLGSIAWAGIDVKTLKTKLIRLF